MGCHQDLGMNRGTGTEQCVAQTRKMQHYKTLRQGRQIQHQHLLNVADDVP